MGSGGGGGVVVRGWVTGQGHSRTISFVHNTRKGSFQNLLMNTTAIFIGEQMPQFSKPLHKEFSNSYHPGCRNVPQKSVEQFANVLYYFLDRPECSVLIVFQHNIWC